MLPHSKEGISHNCKTLGCTRCRAQCEKAVALAGENADNEEAWQLEQLCQVPDELGLLVRAALAEKKTASRFLAQKNQNKRRILDRPFQGENRSCNV
jgi:hypothetical protein